MKRVPDWVIVLGILASAWANAGPSDEADAVMALQVPAAQRVALLESRVASLEVACLNP